MCCAMFPRVAYVGVLLIELGIHSARCFLGWLMSDEGLLKQTLTFLMT